MSLKNIFRTKVCLNSYKLEDIAFNFTQQNARQSRFLHKDERPCFWYIDDFTAFTFFSYLQLKVLSWKFSISPAHMKARALRAIWRQHKTSAHRRHAPFDRPSVWRKIFAYFVFLHDSSGVYANNEKLSELLDFCRRFCDRAGWRLRALAFDGSNYSKKSSTKPSSTWTWHSVKNLTFQSPNTILGLCVYVTIVWVKSH
jgi:hypothetical protein